jgi:hypothetical protein
MFKGMLKPPPPPPPKPIGITVSVPSGMMISSSPPPFPPPPARALRRSAPGLAHNTRAPHAAMRTSPQERLRLLTSTPASAALAGLAVHGGAHQREQAQAEHEPRLPPPSHSVFFGDAEKVFCSRTSSSKSPSHGPETSRKCNERRQGEHDACLQRRCSTAGGARRALFRAAAEARRVFFCAAIGRTRGPAPRLRGLRWLRHRLEPDGPDAMAAAPARTQWPRWPRAGVGYSQAAVRG